MQLSTNVETLAHLNKGLELLRVLSANRDRARRELQFQITLGSVMIALKGYGSPETGQAYVRARELCQEVGDTSELVPTLFGLLAVPLPHES